jgi:hypothetical protein
MTTPAYPAVFPVSADWWSSGDPALTATTSNPEWLPISGLVTFTPRLPKGFTAYMTNFPTAGNVNAVQTVTILGTPTGGTFTLAYGGYTTTALAYNATAAAVQTALLALTSIGTGNATVTSPAAWTYTVTFTGTLGNKPITTMTANGTNLTPGGTPGQVTVTPTTPGSTARNANTGIVIPTRQGRIWAGQLSSIDVNDSPNVDLVANDPQLNLIEQNISSLIYDVNFTQVQYNSTQGTLTNFAFAAPPDTTPVNLTNPTFPRLTYQPPGP